MDYLIGLNERSQHHAVSKMKGIGSIYPRYLKLQPGGKNETPLIIDRLCAWALRPQQKSKLSQDGYRNALYISLCLSLMTPAVVRDLLHTREKALSSLQPYWSEKKETP